MNTNGETGTTATSSKTILHYCKYHPGGLRRPQGLTKKTRPQDNPRRMVKGETKKKKLLELYRTTTIGSQVTSYTTSSTSGIDIILK